MVTPSDILNRNSEPQLADEAVSTFGPDRYPLAEQAPVAASGNALIVIIEKRSFVRDCLTFCLRFSGVGQTQPFPSVEAWHEAAWHTKPAMILLSSHGDSKQMELAQVEALTGRMATAAPVVVMSDIDDSDHVIAVLSKGARGFLPSDISLDVAIKAMNLVRAGGVFVPASSLLSSRRRPPPNAPVRSTEGSAFTARQIAVIKALRQGKANKIIAYELNMCESTVKVHVRNVMKKLNAKNRTQVAFMAGPILENENA